MHGPERHHERPDLVGEHRWGDAGQFILMAIFIGVFVVDLTFTKTILFLNELIPLLFRIPVFLIILICAFYLASLGLKTVFGEIRTEPVVIKKGVFTIVRHPIYLGSILIYLAFVVLILSTIVFIVWIVIVIFYIYISKFEEQLLLNRFGKEYEEYMKKTPMLIPGLKGRFK